MSQAEQAPKRERERAREREPRSQRSASANLDEATVAGFGDEWTRLDQSALDTAERRAIFEQYFRIFPWEALPEGAEGFDLGCGSGRWAQEVAPRVGSLHCIDASPAALQAAKRNLAPHANCVFHVASVHHLPLAEGSMDFGYTLGVLHHVPDTQEGLRAGAALLKPGAPLLVYLYYAFDNRPHWFRIIWRASDLVRRGVSRLPFGPRYGASFALALGVYWPLARLGGLLERLELPARTLEGMPLAAYRHRSFYTMRTDALDRFGTRLERRFTAAQIRAMMGRAGLERITFSPAPPYWCAVGYKV